MQRMLRDRCGCSHEYSLLRREWTPEQVASSMPIAVLRLPEKFSDTRARVTARRDPKEGRKRRCGRLLHTAWSLLPHWRGRFSAPGGVAGERRFTEEN